MISCQSTEANIVFLSESSTSRSVLARQAGQQCCLLTTHQSSQCLWRCTNCTQALLQPRGSHNSTVKLTRTLHRVARQTHVPPVTEGQTRRGQILVHPADAASQLRIGDTARPLLGMLP